ncbi:MAG: flippase [Hungatella sp.]|nr:flippase [Hungatella sp.]
MKFKIKDNKFINNTSWMIAERVYQIGISLVIGMLTARYLGPSNYGIINYIGAFISFVTPLCNLGFDEVLVKKYKDIPDEQGDITGTAMFLELISSVTISFLLVVLIYVINWGDREKTIIAMLQSLYLVFKSTEAIEFWYQSRLEARYTSVIKIIGYTAMTVYRIILLITNKSVVWFGFAASMDMLVIAALYLLLYKSQHAPKLKVNFSIGKGLLSESYHFIVSGMMVVVYSQIDKIMIQHMLGDEQVGVYAAAHTICTLWLFVPTALIASAKPVIFEAKKKNERQYLRRLKQLYAAIFWMGVAVGVLITILSPFVINILYGKQYLGASGALSIGIWYGAFAMLGSARSAWILCEDKNKYIKYILFIGAIINVVLNYIWIKLWGINGAAFATLITQMVTSIFAPLIFKETRIHTKILFEAIVFKGSKDE